VICDCARAIFRVAEPEELQMILTFHRLPFILADEVTEVKTHMVIALTQVTS